MQLTLGISTVFKRLDNALVVARNAMSLFQEIIIVVQACEFESERQEGNITIYYSRTIGLSVSRNMLLAKAKSKWLWINDDDVIIQPEHVQIVARNISRFGSNAELFAGRIGCCDCTGLYKRYRFRWAKPLLFAQVSSIEMVVNREWCLANGVRFDQDFGLGASRPAAEEPIFAADVVTAGGRVKDIPMVIISHPCNAPRLSNEESWTSDRLASTRGAAAARIGGWRGAIFLLFGIASIVGNRGNRMTVSALLKGYRYYERG